MNKNCLSFITNNEIDTKLGPVTELNERNNITLKKIIDDTVSANYDVIVNFPIYGQFGSLRKPDSGCMVKHKNWKQN